MAIALESRQSPQTACRSVRSITAPEASSYAGFSAGPLEVTVLSRTAGRKRLSPCGAMEPHVSKVVPSADAVFHMAPRAPPGPYAIQGTCPVVPAGPARRAGRLQVRPESRVT